MHVVSKMKKQGIGIRARLVHMTLFEVFGILMVTPLFAWGFGHKLAEIFWLSVTLATVAMLWNFLYNIVFDKTEAWLEGKRFERSVRTRVIHAVGFEFSLLVVSLPIVMHALGIGLVAALIMDFGFILFYLIYVFIFNLCFDKVYIALYIKPNPKERVECSHSTLIK